MTPPIASALNGGPDRREGMVGGVPRIDHEYELRSLQQGNGVVGGARGLARAAAFGGVGDVAPAVARAGEDSSGCPAPAGNGARRGGTQWP